MECLAIDWSGALTGEAARIWIARATNGVLTSLVAPGSRDAVQQQLLARRRDPAPCLVGLDFAFSVPHWFARERGWSGAEDVWKAAEEHGETWLRDCPPPFWGRRGVRRPHPAADGLRCTERASVPGHQPKSVFQVGGAGSVGTGSVRGMPMLRALRAARWAVWPFDAMASHTLVEIYPRFFTGLVVKRSAAARATLLDDRHPAIAPEYRALMTRSEDAFDAGLSAIGMSRAIPVLPAPAPEDAVSRLEGAIWAPGVT